jgi:predicted DNA-binding protein YlxM (UPF0122 family)
MELDLLINEYTNARIRVGDNLYGELLDAARTVVRTRRYPPSYSATGDWSDDSVVGMAHEWIAETLLRLGHLDHLLLTNTTLRGFRTGLRLSFADYVLGKRKRGALDHLFRRTGRVLEEDARFRLVADSSKKALRVWGLARWAESARFDGREDDLIGAGFKLSGFPVVRYKASAKKESPILRDPDIGDFVESLLEEMGAGLTLDQICVVYKYRFNLLSEETVSLEEIVRDIEGEGTSLIDVIATNEESPEDAAVYDEVAELLFQELSPRQRLCFQRYHERNATLERVAALAGCKKSTVENELKSTVSMIERYARNSDEAEAIYDRLLARLDLATEMAS